MLEGISTMNKLSIEKRAQIIGMLVEGNSMRAVSPIALPEVVEYNTTTVFITEPTV